MLTLRAIKMPSLAQVGRPNALNRGEWEKLSRLCALIEKEGPAQLNGRRKARQLTGESPATVRGDIERYVQRAMEEEGIDTTEWVIQATLTPDKDDPESLADWTVTLWCRRLHSEAPVGEHVPTISEKVEDATRFNPAEGSPKTEAQMAAVILKRDLEKARPCSCGNQSDGVGQDGEPICEWCRTNGEDRSHGEVSIQCDECGRMVHHQECSSYMVPGKDVRAFPCAQPVNDPEASHYGLGCVLPRGHEGECHAHLWGEDGVCSCGEKAPPPEKGVFGAQVASDPFMGMVARLEEEDRRKAQQRSFDQETSLGNPPIPGMDPDAIVRAIEADRRAEEKFEPPPWVEVGKKVWLDSHGRAATVLALSRFGRAIHIGWLSDGQPEGTTIDRLTIDRIAPYDWPSWVSPGQRVEWYSPTKKDRDRWVPATITGRDDNDEQYGYRIDVELEEHGQAWNLRGPHKRELFRSVRLGTLERIEWLKAQGRDSEARQLMARALVKGEG